MSTLVCSTGCVIRHYKGIEVVPGHPEAPDRCPRCNAKKTALVPNKVRSLFRGRCKDLALMSSEQLEAITKQPHTRKRWKSGKIKEKITRRI